MSLNILCKVSFEEKRNGVPDIIILIYLMYDFVFIRKRETY